MKKYMGKSSIAHFKWWSAGPGAYRASSSAQNKAFGKFTFRAMGMSHLEKTPTSSKKKKKSSIAFLQKIVCLFSRHRASAKYRGQNSSLQFCEWSSNQNPLWCKQRTIYNGGHRRNKHAKNKQTKKTERKKQLFTRFVSLLLFELACWIIVLVDTIYL